MNGMILYMSCQRDSESHGFKNPMFKPKIKCFGLQRQERNLKLSEKKCLTSSKRCDIINEFTSREENDRTLKIEQHDKQKQS